MESVLFEDAPDHEYHH